ncbi:MAG: N-formylglutamate amidohydrolase [Alphaproteobacteria bacterium]|nr:N-formylglutamate amidohydrolase [Alphaproteobacteria bacterium]
MPNEHSAPAAREALLGPGDPPPVIVEGESRRGDCLVLCDHASAAVPRALGTLGLPAAELRRHIALDNGALDAARAIAARFDAPLVATGYSRLVIDCNRAPDDPTSIPLISETTIIPGNRGVPAPERARRLDALFHPYHRRVAAILDGFAARGVVPAILSIHSFTPVYKGEARPWHFGILWNRDPRIPVPLIAALSRVPGVAVGDNLPYSGRDEYGYTTDVHGARRGYPHALVEFRDDLVREAADVARWARIAGDALAPILADSAIRRVERF